MTSQETKNKMAEIIAAAREKQIKSSTIETIKTIGIIEENDEIKTIEVKEAEPVQEQPKEKQLILEWFKIHWHEGNHDKANFENTTFTNWQSVQDAFLKIWEVNEKGQVNGYTKVKIETQFRDEPHTNIWRVDVTNRENNGDFNPIEQKIWEYLEPQMCDNKEYFVVTEETPQIKLSNITIADLLGDGEKEETHPTTGINCTQTPFELVAIVPTTKTAAPNKIEIVDYSEKAFAMVGDTKPIKEKLKDLGGRFNPSLKCGAGWIFSKKHLEAVKKAIK